MQRYRYQTDRQTDIIEIAFEDIFIYIDYKRESKKTEIQRSNRQIDIQTDRQKDRQTDKQLDRQIDRQTERKIDRQTYRKIDRQTYNRLTD